MRLIWMLIGFFSFLLIGTHVALAGPFEKGPVKEPKVKSPLVIKNSKGKVIFEEYFKERKPQYEPYYLGDEVTGFKVYDPATGEIMLDVSMKDGMLSRDIEGTAKGKAKVKEVPTSTSVFEAYASEEGTLILSMGRDGDKILGYSVIENVGQESRRSLRVMGLEDGMVRRTREDLFAKDRKTGVNTKNLDGDYDELTYLEGGGRERRVYKKGFLVEDVREPPEKSLRAFYYQGKLGFWTEQAKKGKERGILKIYDENDALVDTVTGFGESDIRKLLSKESFAERELLLKESLAESPYTEFKFEERDGKPVKIYRKIRGDKVVKEVVREMP